MAAHPRPPVRRHRPRFREPTAAGLFYPSGANSLRRAVDDCLSSVRGVGPGGARAIVVPHSGLRYSGPVAAQGFAALGPAYDRIRRVLVVSGTHDEPLDAVLAPVDDAWLTPIGAVPVAGEAIARMSARFGVECRDHYLHAAEHGIEVQLPFLQRLLGDFSLIPLHAGGARGEAICERIFDEALGRDDTVIVISTDLSRYSDYATVCSLDAHTRRAVECLDGDAVDHCHACAFRPLRALLRAAQRRSLHPHTLALRTSADCIGGDPRHAIGFGAFAFV